MGKPKRELNLSPGEIQEVKEKFEPLWGIEEYCQFTGLKKSTVFSQISRGIDMPNFIRIGSIVKWRPEAVREWIRKKEQEQRRKNFEE